MASEHTGGEEHWHYQEGAGAYTHIVRGPNNEFICQLSQNSTGKSERRARLVASSPRLLAALKRYVADYDPESPPEDMPDAGCIECTVEAVEALALTAGD